MFPSSNDYAAYADPYVKFCPTDDIIDNLENNGKEMDSYLKRISEEDSMYRYAEGKWTVREMVQHIIDGERVFSYRACRIARMDKTPLASFDENEFAKNSNGNARSLESLREEFSAVRKSTLLLFKSFTNEMLMQRSAVSGKDVTVHAIGFIIPGHAWHHLNILQTRYFPAEKMN